MVINYIIYNCGANFTIVKLAVSSANTSARRHISATGRLKFSNNLCYNYHNYTQLHPIINYIIYNYMAPNFTIKFAEVSSENTSARRFVPAAGRLTLSCGSYGNWYNRTEYYITRYYIPQYNIPQYNIPQYNIPQYNIPRYNIAHLTVCASAKTPQNFLW